MAKMTEADIATVIEREIAESAGGEYGSTALLQNRQQAWRYYLGRPRGDEDIDKSQLQSLDVADQVEHLLAQMMQAFTTDCPAEFEADAPNDESQVQVESDAVNKIIMEDNAGYEVIYQALKNALLFKNGIIKVTVEELDESETVVFDGLSGEEQALLEASAPDEAEVEGDDATITVSLTRQRKKLRVEAVEPAQFHISANWHQQDLQDVGIASERKFFTRSDLMGMDFPKGKVRDLPPFTIDTKADSYAKNLDETTGPFTGSTRGQDTIEVWESYVMLPKNLMHNAPESERYRVFHSNRTILSKDRVDIVPYVSGTAWMVPNRWHGLSVFDKLKEVQDSKTAGLRQWADNMGHVNANGGFVTGDVNVEDLGSASAPGHHVRGGLGSTYTPFVVQDIGPAIQGFLNYQDRIRSERGGASIDLGSPESQLVKSSIGATGVAMVMGAQEQMAAFLTRTISETLIRRLFLLVHKTAREVWRQPMLMKKADQWITVNPSQWRERKRVNVKTGLSPGERARKVGNLSTVLQTQMALAQSTGGTMVNGRNIYSAFMNWAKAAELDNPEQYALHPESQESQQAAQQGAQQAQQAQQLQMQVETLGEQVKMQIAQLNDKRERDIAVLKAEVEQMKVLGKATAEFELEQIRARTGSGDQGNSSGGVGPS